jgi:hypothetical protein
MQEVVVVLLYMVPAAEVEVQVLSVATPDPLIPVTMVVMVVLV